MVKLASKLDEIYGTGNIHSGKPLYNREVREMNVLRNFTEQSVDCETMRIKCASEHL